jgi:hypothetical protein
MAQPFVQAAAVAGNSPESEAWFDRYVAEHGRDPGEAEPELGIEKNPDRLIRWNDVEVVCEIKQFERDPFGLLLNRVGVLGLTSALRQVRKAIERAAKQLKPLDGSGRPLVVVLANPKQMPVPFSSHEILWALYGDPVWKIPISAATGGPVGEASYGMDRNGQLRNQHRYLSAVVALRHRTLAQDWSAENIERLKAEHQFDPTDLDAAHEFAKVVAESAVEAEERGEVPDGDYLFAEVFATMSPSAVPLPSRVFDGPRDTRWEFDAAQGAYVKVRSGNRP